MKTEEEVAAKDLSSSSSYPGVFSCRVGAACPAPFLIWRLVVPSATPSPAHTVLKPLTPTLSPPRVNYYVTYDVSNVPKDLDFITQFK